MTADVPPPSGGDEQVFLIHFAQIHENFRKPEIEALAVRHGIPLHWREYSLNSPFALITLPSPVAAATLIQHSILAKGIYTLWSSAASYPTLHHGLQSQLPALASPAMGRSFKFSISSFNHRRSQRQQRDLIETFAYLNLDGEIRMSNPELHFVILESFTIYDTSAPTFCALGLHIADSSRYLIDRYDLKKRCYIGTTSMDAELSLVTANLALCAPGKLAYDPFAGTGSFLVAASAMGATTLGSDIDGRQIRGKSVGKSVKGNFIQYSLSLRYLGGFTADLTHTPLISGRRRFLDAVLCDPPYGVREGLKVLGHRDPAKNGGEPVVKDGVLRYTQPDFVAPKRPYSFKRMLDDILVFAAERLVDGGRVCFWVPSANEEGVEMRLPPKHPRLRLVAVCTQEFNKWSRWLLTYERLPGDGTEDLERPQVEEEEQKMTADELNDFRKKYFEGFRPSKEAPESQSLDP